MRYFIYGKLKATDKMQKIKVVKNGFMFEPNGLNASIFTDSTTDFESIPKVQIGERIRDILSNDYPSGCFELRRV